MRQADIQPSASASTKIGIELYASDNHDGTFSLMIFGTVVATTQAIDMFDAIRIFAKRLGTAMNCPGLS